MAISLPEHKILSLSQLRERWKCKEHDIIMYGISGQLAIYAISNGWRIECGYFDIDDKGQYFKVPRKKYMSSGDMFKVKQSDLNGLCYSFEKYIDSFEAKKDEYIDVEHEFLDVFQLFHSNLYFYLEDVKLLENKPPKETKNHSIDKPSYTTPYLQVMYEAINEFNLTENEQSTIEALKHWFKDKEFPCGHKITENEAKKLASFVRLTSSRKGK